MFNYDPLMDIRTSLATSTNTTGVLHSGSGGAEIQKRVETEIKDSFNRDTDFDKFVSRKPMSQLAFIWDLKTATGNKSVFYSEGVRGTAAPSTVIQLYALAKALRSDYEVTGLMQASAFINSLEEEAKDAVTAINTNEEKAMLCGTDDSAYGLTGAYSGLLQLMGSYVTFGDTTSTYGIARGSGKTYLDVALVAGSATSAHKIALVDLKSAITKSNKAGAKGHKRIFLMSEEMADAIDSLLTSNQRFVAPSLQIEGGLTVQTYQGIPIIRDRFMDKNGITWDGSDKTASHADNAAYLLDMDNIEFRVLAGVDKVHTPITGAGYYADTQLTGSRADVRGGYFKTYGVFLMRRFDTQVLIYNITVS